ncbi:MAG TPA: oligosaccharide flippase family protein, partial [Candidatus Paceibacterota bacterium]
MIQKLKTAGYDFLRGTEKYAKTDMLYLAKGGFWITLGQGISTIAGLALAVGFANLISKEVYGTYSFILSLAGVISVLTLTGTRTAMTQAVARGFEGTLRASFWMSIRWSIF